MNEGRTSRRGERVESGCSERTQRHLLEIRAVSEAVLRGNASIRTKQVPTRSALPLSKMFGRPRGHHERLPMRRREQRD